jgi:hypothetical protein
MEQPMPEPRQHRVTLYSGKSADDRSILEAVVTVAGDLVLEGHDIGPKVEQFVGDSDFEYWQTVKAPNVPMVLLQLIKDRFKTRSEFDAWLTEKGIPSGFISF